MPDNVNTTTFAGADGAYCSFVNSAGIMNGFGNVSAAAASSGMRKMKAIETVPSALPGINRKVIKGDNRPYDQFTFAADTLPGGDLLMGTSDLALDAAAQNSSLYTLGAWTMGIYGISNPTFANMLLLAHQDAHSQDVGNSGVGYINSLYPNCQLFPLAEENPNYQTEGKNRYGVTFLPFSSVPWGGALDNTNFSVSDGTKIKWFSQYRSFLYAKIGDGTWTNIVLDYTPVSAAKTKVFVTASGVTTQATVSSVTPSTKTVVVSAAPANLASVVVIYEASKLV